MWQPDISVTSEFPVIRLESPPCVEITSYKLTSRYECTPFNERMITICPPAPASL